MSADKIYIWLQSGEAEGQAACGCRLVREWDDGNPAFIMCAKHLANESLLAALKNLVARGLIKDKDGDHYEEVLEAIAEAEGGPGMVLNGETAEQWAERMFEFEVCSECGKDKQDHDIIPFMGNWFARCKTPGRIIEVNGHFECASCGREWSAMMGDNELPESCPDCADGQARNYDYQLIRGKIKAEWVNLGEGRSGDYDPDDPEDVALLRFDISRLTDNPEDGRNLDWEMIEDASYCTNMPVDTPGDILMDALTFIMNEIYDEAAAGNSIKKLCERLSWIGPDFNKKGEKL